MLLAEKKKGVSQNGQTLSISGTCSYCVLDRPAFERCQTLLHPELTPWWSFLFSRWCPPQETSQPHPPIFWYRIFQFKTKNDDNILREGPIQNYQAHSTQEKRKSRASLSCNIIFFQYYCTEMKLTLKWNSAPNVLMLKKNLLKQTRIICLLPSHPDFP